MCYLIKITDRNLITLVTKEFVYHFLGAKDHVHEVHVLIGAVLARFYD
jgi:hypothetical protein